MSYKNKNWLHDNYIDINKSTLEIAKMCNVSNHTILRWLHRFDIELKPLGGWKHTQTAREKMSIARRAWLSDKRNCPNFGKHLSEECKRKISDSLKGFKQSEETKKKISKTLIGNSYTLGHKLSQEHKNKISESERGSKHWNWQNGKSFEPYCPRFTKELREAVRNRDNRNCQMCGKNEIFLREKLCVHHVDLDKMQGCNGNKWYLVSLCRSCHIRLHNGDTLICYK